LGADGQPLPAPSDDDPAYAFAPAHPAMTVEKTLNDSSTSHAAPGVSVEAESTVTVSVVVTNTGDVTLTGLVASDATVVGGALTCAVPTLAPAASTTCTGTLVAPEPGGAHTDTVSVTGTPVLADGQTPALGPDGQPLTPLTVTDTAYAYAPAHPGIVVEKFINEDEASGSAPGVLVGAESEMLLTFIVTNTGDVALDGVTVADDAFGGGVVCGYEGVLAPGESGQCTMSLTGPLPGGTHVDTVTATGTPVLGDGTTPALGPDGQPLTPVTATDTAYAYAGAHPGVAVVKRINGHDAASAPGISVPEGSTMTITFEVTNTGDVRLDPVNVTDTTVSGIQCPKSGLDPGEIMTCTATLAAPAVGSQHTNTVTVTGTPVLPDGTPALGDDGTPVAAPTATDTAYAVSTKTPLPDTGTPIAPLFVGGLGLFILGMLLLLASPRRRSARGTEG